ncbi:MAG TPA: cytochrome P450 [Mycobacteriales bacterium]|nr:cytochrome P450 [Mycobacteriales bacterium]
MGHTYERPPGPSSWAAFRAIIGTRSTDPDFFTRAAERYPRVAHVRLGGEHLYLLSHPDTVRLLLVEAGRNTTKSRGLQGAKRILGDGLLTSSGELHRLQRRLIQPAFHHERVAGYVAEMAAAADRLSARWTPGRQVDMAAEMSALTLEVVGRALFGSDLERDFSAVREALTELLKAYNRSFLPWFDLAMRLGTPLARRVNAAKARLDAVVDGMIARHDPDSDDLLAAMQSAGQMSPAQLRDESMTMLLAGHETTASTLAFAWYLLDRNPDAARWLWDEVDTVGPSGQLIRTRAVVAETMRLYPPAWVLGRRLTADLRIDDWTAPPGSTCLVSQWVLHRDPWFWTDPLTFAPQRWIDADGAFGLDVPGQPRLAYFPFGAGSRICVGESFAWAEATVLLAGLARSWWPRLAADYRLRLRPAITLRPDGVLPMTLYPR